MIKVDVILICYNQEQYIEQALNSILEQKVSDNVQVRVIIADDCSTDSTLNIIKSTEPKSKYPFLYLEEAHNLGFHKNYQRAFEACDGDYVAILEGDDWWHTDNHIQQHVDFLETHSKNSMSFNVIRSFNEINKSFSNHKWFFPKDFFNITLKDQISKGNQIGNLSSCVFRTKLLKSLPIGFFNLNFADWELGMWMAQFGFIGLLKESTSTYRNALKGEWTKLSQENKIESMLTTLKQADELFNFKYRKWFEEGMYNIKNNIQPKPYMTWKSKIKRWLKTIK